MNVLIIDNGSRYLDELLTLTAHLNPKVLDFNSLPTVHLKESDLVILSGGHSEPVLWHDKLYSNEISIIKKHTGPIIGICLGFELICHVFGSHLHLLKKRRKGLIEIKPTIVNEIIKENQNIEVYENHNWSVRKVGAPLLALAESEDGVEVIEHESRPIYAMQFHPEGVNGSGKEVFLNIMQLLKSSKYVQ